MDTFDRDYPSIKFKTKVKEILLDKEEIREALIDRKTLKQVIEDSNICPSCKENLLLELTKT